MQPGQFPRQIQTDPMTRRSRWSRTVMEPFEDVFARRKCGTRVANPKYAFRAVAKRADPNSSAGAIVLPRVLQEVLHDERRVVFFAGHKKPLWKFLFNLHTRRIWQRAEIVQP